MTGIVFDMLDGAEGLLPEHFFIDPDSNHKVDSIVPFRDLIDRYCFLMTQSFPSENSLTGIVSSESRPSPSRALISMLIEVFDLNLMSA